MSCKCGSFNLAVFMNPDVKNDKTKSICEVPIIKIICLACGNVVDIGNTFDNRDKKTDDPEGEEKKEKEDE